MGIFRHEANLWTKANRENAARVLVDAKTGSNSFITSARFARESDVIHHERPFCTGKRRHSSRAPVLQSLGAVILVGYRMFDPKGTP